MTYKVKNVEAVQFDPEIEPWPDGISVIDGSDPVRYLFTGAWQCEIKPGDYVMAGRLVPAYMSQEDFEYLYEPL